MKREKLVDKMRRLVADYMASEGCGCCGDYDAHKKAREALAKTLDVPPHPDQDDYYPFDDFETKETPK